MNWIVFLLVGLIAGAIAKAVMPGTRDEPAGWLLTLVLGICGAFVGGWLGATLFGTVATGFIGQILLAAVGAIVIIAVLRLFTGGRRTV
jgi:uncharacterized membrane protein YeaQ/YmgE (transglycosylase-associated protein family)